MQHLVNSNVESNLHSEIYSFCVDNLLQYINIAYNNFGKNFLILIDTGAQINIIKKNKVDPRFIDESVKHLISGITKNNISTLGVINIPINNINFEFHAVPDTLSFPYDGILRINC